jgi:ferritin-like metal-binding protein YciE
MKTLKDLFVAGQKVEHYEIASYGCLHEWAGLLGHEKAAGLLKENLDQEKAADEALTELARSGNNEEARDGESDTESGENLKIQNKTTGRSATRRLQPAGTRP